MAKKLTNEEFIEKAKKLFPNYDYSLVDYKGEKTKLEIICPEHGVFIKEARVLLRNSGCPYCANLAFDKNSFVFKAIKVHGNNYDYSKTKYINTRTKVLITCKKCGEGFLQKPYAHLYGEGCPYCKISHGEEVIQTYLNKEKISFIRNKKFDNLIDERFLTYDFYIPNNNLLIEFNGKQHYNKNAFNKSYHTFLIQKHHDWLKRKYARDNKINLLVISYWENIEERLNECFSI